MKGLILAGGHGTRLRPLTFTGNKHMIPIANKPMLMYGLEHLAKAGIQEIAIVLGPIQEGIKEILGDGSRFGVNLTYVNQPEPKGLAHAVLISEFFLKGEPFVMYLGDNLLKQGVKPLVYTYVNENSDCVVCLTKVNDPSRYGIVELNQDGKIEKLVEKPKVTKSDLALVGVYLFNDSIFEAVRSIKSSWRNELEITDAIQFLLEKGKKISIQQVSGWWKDTGKPDDLLEANQLILDDIEPRNDGAIDPSCYVTGKIAVGKNTLIKSGARIKGPVIIGENCEIGSDVYIGPYTSIGDGVKILSGEIEGSIVMQNTIIKCGKRIVDSIIGKNSHLESNSGSLPSGLRFIVGDNTLCRV